MAASKLTRIVCEKCGRRLDVSSIRPLAEIECPECGQRQRVPIAFGQYHLLTELGTGGMGAVYQALDTTLNRRVAIKVMKKSMGVDKDLVQSFLREARAAAALNHSNVVQIYACGEQNGQPFIVMELVSGGRLDKLMAGDRPVPEVRALEIALDVSDGLRAAHELGLVHGDIKPANILFDAKGLAKIADFGLAEFVNRQQGKGGVWGTPYYISPERARGAKADHRSDVYSLGATLYHAIAAKPPFDGATATDVVVARLKGPAPDILDFRPEIQKETRDVIMRMLEADPAVRYPTSASLQADLREALAKARASRPGAARAGSFPAAAAKAAPKSKKSPVPIVLGGLVTVGLLAAVIYVATHRKPPPAPPPVTNAAPVRPSAPDPTRIFDASEAAFIVRAGQDVLAGKPLGGFDAFNKLKKQLPANSGRAMLATVLQAIPLWADGSDRGARATLEEVSRVKISAEATNLLHIAPTLARVGLGEITPEAARKNAAGWPAWYPHLVALMSGASFLGSGDVARAEAALAAYTGATATQPEWVYAFRDPARKWIADIQAWQVVLKMTGPLIGAGQLDQALAALKDFRGKAVHALYPAVDVEIRRVEGLKKKASAPKVAP